MAARRRSRSPRRKNRALILAAVAVIIILMAGTVTGFAYGVGAVKDRDLFGRLNPLSVAEGVPQSQDRHPDSHISVGICRRQTTKPTPIPENTILNRFAHAHYASRHPAKHNQHTGRGSARPRYGGNAACGRFMVAMTLSSCTTLNSRLDAKREKPCAGDQPGRRPIPAPKTLPQSHHAAKPDIHLLKAEKR